MARDAIPVPDGRRPPGGSTGPVLRGTESLLTLRWRETDSNHRSREGSDRSLDGLICWNREFPRCRLFRPSGAEVLRRNSGRIGGFEKGEFERHSARKQVAA